VCQGREKIIAREICCLTLAVVSSFPKKGARSERRFKVTGARVFSAEFIEAERNLNGESVSALSNESHIERSPLCLWRDCSREYNRLIVQAAANAQKAVDSILGGTFESEGETEEREEEAATSGFPAPQPRTLSA
jgi:antirestriction protein ArdC